MVWAFGADAFGDHGKRRERGGCHAPYSSVGAGGLASISLAGFTGRVRPTGPACLRLAKVPLTSRFLDRSYLRSPAGKNVWRVIPPFSDPGRYHAGMDAGVVSVWLACAGVTVVVAQAKGRSVPVAVALGILLGLIGILIEICLPSRKKA